MFSHGLGRSSKPPSKPPSKPSSKTPSKETTKPQALTPEEEEQLRLDEERLRQEAVLARLANAGCICAGIAGVDGTIHGQTLALEADTCRRSVRARSKDQGLGAEMWIQGPSLAQARWHCCAAALGDGQLLVVGGFDENGLPLDTTEVVDFVTGSVQPGPKLSTPRAGSSAVTLPLPVQDDEESASGKPWIMVLGGYGADAGTTTEVLDLEAMRSHPGPTLLTRRACCVASMYGEDEVMVAGGFDEFASVSSTEFINLFKLKHTAVAEPCFKDSSEPGPEDEVPLHPADLGRAFAVPGPEMLERRAACTAVEVPKPEEARGRSKVWIIGGTNERGQRLATSEWIEVILPDHFEDGPSVQRRLSRRSSRPEAVVPVPAESLEAENESSAVESAADAAADADALEALEAAADGAAAAQGEVPEADPEATAEAAEAAEPEAADEDTEGEALETEPLNEAPGHSGPSGPSHLRPDNTRHFAPGPSMLQPRSGLAAVRLSEVVVLIAGGVGPEGEHLDSTEFFDFEDRKEIMQQGPCLSLGCDGPSGFSYCAAGRAVVEF